MTPKEFELLLREECEVQGVTDPSHIAYILATAQHECLMGRRLVEMGDRDYFKKYANRLGNNQPGDDYRYRGRGAVQITGRANYRKMGQALWLPLEDDPDLAQDPDIAVRIIVYGMLHGSFTGRKLADFGFGAEFKPVAARRIVNGTDRAYLIAEIYATFLAARGVKLGDKGPDVSEVQTALANLGYMIVIDGDFGPTTQLIVKQLQRKHHLTPDGVVGPRTRKLLGV